MLLAIKWDTEGDKANMSIWAASSEKREERVCVWCSLSVLGDASPFLALRPSPPHVVSPWHGQVRTPQEGSQRL